MSAMAALPAPGPAATLLAAPFPFGLDRNSSLPWTLFVLFTVLALLPAVLLAMTPFVRILLVFHFLRQALGTQTAPTNQTLVGLALVLTYFVMAPVGAAIHRDALVPLERGRIGPRSEEHTSELQSR